MEDVLLSRYAAYLVVMNGSPKMPILAMGQEYFAEQPRLQERTQPSLFDEPSQEG